MEIKFCPYCRGDVTQRKGANSIYCPTCKVIVYISAQITNADSPLLKEEK